MNGFLSLCGHWLIRGDDEFISLGLRVVTGCSELLAMNLSAWVFVWSLGAQSCWR